MPNTLVDCVKEAFMSWHGKTAMGWQLDAAAHILQLSSRHPTPGPLPVLLVRSTGGGKSAVRDVCGVILRGVVITIVPLLSLAADQTEKLSHIIEQAPGDTKVYNIDSMSMQQQRRLQQYLKATLAMNYSTVFLFASPQILVSSNGWMGTIVNLIEKDAIRLIAIDECHLYASQGVEFRPSFTQLKDTLFVSLRQSHRCVPILFMTATASLRIVEDLEELTGEMFNRESNLLWPTSFSGVSRRNVAVELCFTENPLARVKTEVSACCGSSHNVRKVIVYSNSRSRAIRMYQETRMMCNEESFVEDVLLVHSELFREQKFHHTKLFTGPDLLENDNSGQLVTFCPRALFATAGCANAGLDCSDVYTVVRDGIPASLEDLSQEMGRCGRRSGASFKTDKYVLYASLDHLVSLMARIYLGRHPNTPKNDVDTANNTGVPVTVDQSGATEDLSSSILHNIFSPFVTTTNLSTSILSAKDLSDRQYGNVLKVTSIICLDQRRCIHYSIERELVNPYSAPNTDVPATCGGACWRCSDPPVQLLLDRPIIVDNLRLALVDMFVRNPVPRKHLLLSKNVFVKTCISYKHGDVTFVPFVFAINDKRKAMRLVKGLVVKLLCLRVLVPDPDVIVNGLSVVLGCETNGDRTMNRDDIWTRIATK